MKPKISLITFGTRDLEKMIAFYRDGLGFPTHNYKPGDDMVMFQLEGTWLGLFPRAELAKDATVSTEGSGFSGVALAHNAPSKEEVDRVFAHALAAGARSVKAPEDVFWGGYSGYFADPEGNLWEVAFNPFTDLT
jgi:catechol 2,3-dioxygenase-like lactoylglutathione lyase family enzyme